MKLRIFSGNILIKILLIFTSLFIVEAAKGQLRYGFRFGGDFADARIKNVENYSLINRSGFSGGLVLEYQFKNCGFAPDIALLYARHNTRLRHNEADPGSFGRNFIDMPLHLKYKFWIKSFHDLFGPMIYAGPVCSFKLDHQNSYPLKTKVFQPGIDVGIGFDIVNFIQISGGYRFGLGNAAKNFADYPDAVLRTNSWNVSATLLFDF